MEFWILDDRGFVHPSIINPELDEFLLRLPKIPNLHLISSFEASALVEI
ncbi:hypothetical protein GTQ43_09060 [Nostoc sp. KVJ3]|nr:hypothetical protein [Nostoc sp. KVJ3]MCW5313942.1 hypothetical protein [Nostoc sp. KVJ3]